MKAKLNTYSMGIGDRFGYEGTAQLAAFLRARDRGLVVTPIWNKSNREHTIIGTTPDQTRGSADRAVRASGWHESYFVDADHIGLGTVDRFLPSSDFFTIDVADFIGKPAQEADLNDFRASMKRFHGTHRLPVIDRKMPIDDDLVHRAARQYLFAAREAGRVYRHIASAKSPDSCIIEVSFDEAASPQTPSELFVILAALSREKIPLTTIAPKFTGAFLKGIDYVGDVKSFEREFEEGLAILAFAKEKLEIPEEAKFSIHSGSDKFSLYPVIHRALGKFNAGIHLKTAGTTWLEEVIGLAASGADGLRFAKELYEAAFNRYDELAQPYLPVIDINRAALPRPGTVNSWSAEKYIGALEHEQACAMYDTNFRQLVHISFRIAAEMGARFTGLLESHREVIASHVTSNIYRRHMVPLFFGAAGQD